MTAGIPAVSEVYCESFDVIVVFNSSAPLIVVRVEYICMVKSEVVASVSRLDVVVCGHYISAAFFNQIECCTVHRHLREVGLICGSVRLNLPVYGVCSGKACSSAGPQISDGFIVLGCDSQLVNEISCYITRVHPATGLSECIEFHFIIVTVVVNVYDSGSVACDGLLCQLVSIISLISICSIDMETCEALCCSSCLLTGFSCLLF